MTFATACPSIVAVIPTFWPPQSRRAHAWSHEVVPEEFPAPVESKGAIACEVIGVQVEHALVGQRSPLGALACDQAEAQQQDETVHAALA